MRRMFSEKQIKEMISAGAQSEIAEALEGDISIGGDLSVTGDIAGADITGDSIIENMSGYSFELIENTGITIEGVYAGCVKNGNKLTFVLAVNLTRTDTVDADVQIGAFAVPDDVWSKLYPTQIGGYPFLDVKSIFAFVSESSYKELTSYIMKASDKIRFNVNKSPINSLVLNTKYYYRYEATFLLSENLIPSGE